MNWRKEEETVRARLIAGWRSGMGPMPELAALDRWKAQVLLLEQALHDAVQLLAELETEAEKWGKVAEDAEARIAELERERDAWKRMADGHRMVELEAALREVANGNGSLASFARRALEGGER